MLAHCADDSGLSSGSLPSLPAPRAQTACEMDLAFRRLQDPGCAQAKTRQPCEVQQASWPPWGACSQMQMAEGKRPQPGKAHKMPSPALVAHKKMPEQRAARKIETALLEEVRQQTELGDDTASSQPAAERRPGARTSALAASHGLRAEELGFACGAHLAAGVPSVWEAAVAG